MSLLDDVRKYIDYVFDTRSFAPHFDPQAVRVDALRAARAIRGSDRGPAIIIHGIMPRSGTVYAGELLRLHPDPTAFPNRIWEAPFLQLSGDIAALQETFLWIHRHNEGKMNEKDFYPIFGAAFIAYLHSFMDEGQRMLLKVPGVHYLSDFYHMFPEELFMIIERGPFDNRKQDHLLVQDGGWLCGERILTGAAPAVREAKRSEWLKLRFPSRP